MTIKDTGSVTRWINDLDGEPGSRATAQEELWNRYFTRLSALARKRMPAVHRRALDEEDAALSALNSFFRRAGEGEFPNLHDRNALWPLLARIASFKAMQRIEYERAQKRGGGNVVCESELESSTTNLPTLDDVLTSTPTPDFATIMDEQVQQMMTELKEDELRAMAQLKLAGYTNPEIAEKLGRGLRTIERKFKRIRSIWSAAVSAKYEEED